MRNLFVSFNLSLVSFFSFAQNITIHVTEVKDYVHTDSVSYIDAMNDSRSDNPNRAVDGIYNIDLKSETLTFKTLKNEGTRKINSVEKEGNNLLVNFTDDYLEDENGKKLEVLLVINAKSGSVVFSYFDPVYNYTLAQDFTKNVISLNQ